MIIEEYKVIADFYPGKVARLCEPYIEAGWDYLNRPGCMRTATLNNGAKAPTEINVYQPFEDTLFYCVLVRYEEITYDDVSNRAKSTPDQEVLGHQESGEGSSIDPTPNRSTNQTSCGRIKVEDGEPPAIP